MNGTATDKPTTPMFDLIRTLLIEIGELDAAAAESWRTELNLARERKQFGYQAGREAIQDLIAAKRDLRRKANRTSGKIQLPDVPGGRYAVEVEGTLKFYSVEVSDTGFVKVYVWASDEQHELPFKALAGVLKLIEAAGPKAASIRFGQEIGVCGRCGRTLTDESSRAAGIGPVCATKF